MVKLSSVIVVLALGADAFMAPTATAPRGGPQFMKKPSPPSEAGPLPGLSAANYKVLAGATALGVVAPALLFAQALVPASADRKSVV